MRQAKAVLAWRQFHNPAGFFAFLPVMRELIFDRLSAMIRPDGPLAPASGRSIALALAIAGTLSAMPAVHAEGETFKGEYTVSYLGLTIAKSTFDSRIDDAGFSVAGTVSSAGLAKIFDSTKGTASASGTFAGNTTRPDKFKMNYAEGKRKQMTALAFRDGEVVSTENVPPLKKRKKKWVPLNPIDLKGALDPLSAGLIKAESPDRVCGRTLKLFDGEMRMDAALRSTKSPSEAENYGHGVVTCRVKVKPVSGYRKGRRALDYLEKESKIVVAFAPLGSTGVYAPVYATVGTEIGTVTVRVKRLDTKK